VFRIVVADDFEGIHELVIGRVIGGNDSTLARVRLAGEERERTFTTRLEVAPADVDDNGPAWFIGHKSPTAFVVRAKFWGSQQAEPDWQLQVRWRPPRGVSARTELSAGFCCEHTGDVPQPRPRSHERKQQHGAQERDFPHRATLQKALGTALQKDTFEHRKPFF